MPEAQAVLVTGLCKLLLAGMITEPRVSTSALFLVCDHLLRSSKNQGVDLLGVDVHLTDDDGQSRTQTMPVVFLPRLLVFFTCQPGSHAICKSRLVLQRN